jgi:uncharacterized phiE125 gp8 family phage protein
MTFTFTPSAALPVSLAEFRDHLRYPSDVSDEDADLTAKLSAAVCAIEDATGRVLISSTATLTLDCWPCKDYIELPGGQTSSITSLKYTDSAGVVTTYPATDYKLVRGYSLTAPTQTIGGMARLQLGYAKYWPTVTLDTGEPIEVVYVTGWKDADSVPWQLKAASLIKGEILYWRDPIRNPTSETLQRLRDMEFGVDRLIARFRLWGF